MSDLRHACKLPRTLFKLLQCPTNPRSTSSQLPQQAYPTMPIKLITLGYIETLSVMKMVSEFENIVPYVVFKGVANKCRLPHTSSSLL